MLCHGKTKDLNENINIIHPSVDKKRTFHIFFQIFTLLSPTRHYFEYFQEEEETGVNASVKGILAE